VVARGSKQVQKARCSALARTICVVATAVLRDHAGAEVRSVNAEAMITVASASGGKIRRCSAIDPTTVSSDESAVGALNSRW